MNYLMGKPENCKQALTISFIQYILRILQPFFSFTVLLYSICQQPTYIDTFICSFVCCAVLHHRYRNIYNEYRTNAAAEASYDRARSLTL